jgi:hypothetical protein
MIKLEKVLPAGGSKLIPIKSLRKGYFQMIEGMQNQSKLDDGLKKGKLHNYRLTARNKSCLRFISRSYKKIILGTPQSLSRLTDVFRSKRWDIDLFVNGRATPFGKALLWAFGYKTRFRSHQSRGVWFAEQLNLKVCPYCNSQYTLVVSQLNGDSLAKFQFDHFFPLERFPFLSISLFNLIPSCANCNHKKSSQLLELKKAYHPYHNSINEFACFKVVYPPNHKALSIPNLLKMNLSHIKIAFVSKYKETQSLVSNYDQLFDITFIYKRHADVAHMILINSILYDKYYQRGTLGIKNLFPDKRILLKYILGNYVETDEILKKPLSKFTQDIAHQLKLL